ncbi:MAG: NAD(P)-binding domain-containing protein [Alphaproteobacteria bacterium]
MTTIGILGVGYLGECLAEGLAGAIGEGSDFTVLLSPRSADRAARLAEKHGYEIARDNADLVTRSDFVFLATKPEQIVDTAKGLPWRAGQRAVSIAAGITLPAIRDAVAPATALRSMPIAASRIRQSPTAYCPPDEMAEAVFAALGSAHAVDGDDQFETASIFGAYYGHLHVLYDTVAGWAQDNGLPAETARALTARMAQAAAASILTQTDRRPRAPLDDLMTEGGITKAGLNILDTADAFTPWSDALSESRKRSGEIAGEG